MGSSQPCIWNAENRKRITIDPSASLRHYQQERRLKRRNTPGGLEIQYTAQIVNTLELSAPPPNRGKKTNKKTLQPGNQPGEVSNNKYICSSKILVALWNSRVVKQSSDLKPSSIPLRCHWKPNCQQRSSLSLVAVLLIPFVRHVHLYQYSWFGRIPSVVANRYRKST